MDIFYRDGTLGSQSANKTYKTYKQTTYCGKNAIPSGRKTFRIARITILCGGLGKICPYSLGKGLSTKGPSQKTKLKIVLTMLPDNSNVYISNFEKRRHLFMIKSAGMVSAVAD